MSHGNFRARSAWVWSALALSLLTLCLLPACRLGGDFGGQGNLRFNTRPGCNWGCDQLRGIAVGSSIAVGISDGECTGADDGGFEVSVSGTALRASVGTTRFEDGYCEAYAHVVAVSDGDGTLTVRSPSGRSDSYRLFAATPTTMTFPEEGAGWAGRAEMLELEIQTDTRLWTAYMRVSDEDHRQLMFDEEGVRLESANLDVLPVDDTFGPNLFRAGETGSSVVTATYGGLSAELTVRVVER